jgi:hypothetical protein
VDKEKSKLAGDEHEVPHRELVTNMEKKIEQLEYIINHLQTRIGQIAASYELEVAVGKSELHLENKYGAEEVD